MRELPTKPSLEQLKKQAKDLLQSHLSGDPSICKVLGSLSRFAGCTDEEILSVRVTLNEAREAIAMQYGFHSWQALSKYVISLNQDMNGCEPKISERILARWQDSIDGIVNIAGLPAALVMRIVGEDIEVFLSSRSEGNPYQPGDKEYLIGSGLYCERVISTREKLLVKDALSDPDWARNPDIKLNMISYLGFPLMMPKGEVFGTICVLDSHSNGYSPKVVELLNSAKTMIEAHLELLLANQGLRRKNEQLKSALEEVKNLRYLIPVCSHCNLIRTNEDSWIKADEYYKKKGPQFTHTICPECFNLHFKDEKEK